MIYSITIMVTAKKRGGGGVGGYNVHVSRIHAVAELSGLSNKKISAKRKSRFVNRVFFVPSPPGQFDFLVPTWFSRSLAKT